MVVIIILFFVLGIILINGKGSFLIAGYNTMSDQEKAAYDTISLSKFMGKMMFALGFSMIILWIGELYSITYVVYFSIALIIGIILFMLLYMNTGNRFKKEKRDPRK